MIPRFNDEKHVSMLLIVLVFCFSVFVILFVFVLFLRPNVVGVLSVTEMNTLSTRIGKQNITLKENNEYKHI